MSGGEGWFMIVDRFDGIYCLEPNTVCGLSRPGFGFGLSESVGNRHLTLKFSPLRQQNWMRK